jgi:hypothetical protein
MAHGVTPQIGNRCVCYCDDCQAFPKALGRPDVLDANGGTDIFQLSPARIEFTHGVDLVACLRLTEKGLVRWYASCCNTPIGNTLTTGSIPFVGLICSFVPEAVTGTLGPIRARIPRVRHRRYCRHPARQSIALDDAAARDRAHDLVAASWRSQALAFLRRSNASAHRHAARAHGTRARRASLASFGALTR